MFISLSKNFLFFSTVEKNQNDQVNVAAVTFKDGSSKNFQWINTQNLEKNNIDAKKYINNGPIDVISGCVSSNEHYFAFGDNQKNLYIFDAYQKLVLKTKVPRNCIRVQFSSDSKRIIYMDKSDIYETIIETNTTKHLLGHLSMLLDFLITPDEKFIISVDRDEKIRVSHYPNTYNIWTYCLGHEQFVSCVRWLSKAHNVVSGSGDGTVRIWNLDEINSKQIAIYDFKHQKEANDGADKVVEYNSPIKSIDVDITESLILVSFYKRNEVVVLEIDSNYQLSKRANLILPHPTFEVLFDRAHASFFWVFGRQEEKAFAPYQYFENKVSRVAQNMYQLDELANDENLIKTIQSNAENREKMVQGLFKYQYESEKADSHKESIENENFKKLKS